MTRLNYDSIERILVALVEAQDEDGRAVRISPQEALQPWLLEQIPKSILGLGTTQ